MKLTLFIIFIGLLFWLNVGMWFSRPFEEVFFNVAYFVGMASGVILYHFLEIKYERSRE